MQGENTRPIRDGKKYEKTTINFILFIFKLIHYKNKATSGGNSHFNMGFPEQLNIHVQP